MDKIRFCLWLGLIGLAGCTTTTPKNKKQLAPSQDTTVAVVNGQPIKRDRLLKTLLPAYGSKVLDQLVLLDVVRQEAARRGIIVMPDEVQAEFEKILNDMAPRKNRREQMALFNFMLKKRNITRVEFDILVERQACLRRLVDPNVTVTESMLEEEFERQYGRQVVVRQLVRSSFRDIQQAQQLLEAGAEFKMLVDRLSQDQPSLNRDGLIGPFSRVDEHIPEPVRQAAFALKSVGQHSPIVRFFDQADLEWWCLLQLEKDYPAEEVDKTQVNKELRQIIQRRVINRRTLELQRRLKKQASITLLDHTLK